MTLTRGRSLTGWLVLAGGCGLIWPGAWAQTPAKPASTGIAQEARHVLLALPYFRVFDNLDFRVEGDTVTLLGQVTRPSLKSDAEKAVKQISGVGRVNNQIKVLPLSAADERLRLAVYVATYGQPILSQYPVQAVPPVHIIVKNGNVTLVGTVDDQMDKTLFFTYASGVPGVVSVTDHLRIAK